MREREGDRLVGCFGRKILAHSGNFALNGEKDGRRKPEYSEKTPLTDPQQPAGHANRCTHTVSQDKI